MKHHIVLAACLSISSIFSFPAAAESGQTKGQNGDEYHFSGLLMAVPEGYALHEEQQCDTLAIYTKKTSQESLKENRLLYINAVCSQNGDETATEFKVTSFGGVNYLSSDLGSTVSYSDLVSAYTFSEKFSRYLDFNSTDVLDEAGFLLAQVQRHLSNQSETDNTNQTLDTSWRLNNHWKAHMADLSLSSCYSVTKGAILETNTQRVHSSSFKVSSTPETSSCSNQVTRRLTKQVALPVTVVFQN